jgi:hypothetical protein
MEELPIDVGGGSSATPGSTVSLGGRRRPGGLVAIAFIVVAVIAVVVGTRRSSDQASHATTTTSLAPTSVGRTTVAEETTVLESSTLETPSTIAPDRTVTELGAPVLASHTRTELIVHTLDSLLRINLDSGEVVRTQVPIILTGEQTFMAVGSRSVVLRPANYIQGYVVPDDGGSRPAPGLLADGTLGLFSNYDQFWMYLGQPTPRLEGVSFDGGDQGGIETPNLVPWGPDGTGQVVLTGLGGAYVAGSVPNLQRITTGDVFAAGPTTWLVRECDDRHVCTMSTIDRESHHRTTFDLPLLIAEPSPPVAGVIAPDGRIAAVVMSRTQTVDIINLWSGIEFSIPTAAIRVAPVWSLDGRYLFYVDDAGWLWVYDRNTDRVLAFPVPVHDVQALAVRPTP